MLEVKAPMDYSAYNPIIFLAGSIEMGTAEHWQSKVVKELENLNVTVLNPRRDNWDNTINQTPNDPKFFEQVNWELNGLYSSDIIFFYFDPTTKSPVSMLELGLYARHEGNKIICCCPDGFWRKGNIEMICDRYNILIENSLDEAIELLKFKLKQIK